MGWNGSSSAGQPANGRAGAPRPPQKKLPSALRGILAGVLIVAALAAALFFVFSGDRPAPKVKEPKKPAAIKEVKPAPAPKAKPLTNAEAMRRRYPELTIPDGWEKPYPPAAYWPDGSLKRYSRYVHVITNKLSDYQHSIEEKTFKNGADQHIALLLNQEPGTKMIGEMKYGRHFVKSFLKSLETPIIIEKDDTEEVAAMKRAVIEAKADLKKRYDAGEDIAEIMNQTSKELRELGAYREELEKEIKRVRREKGRDMTAQDYKDLIGAANKMLEEHGCAPMRMPELTLKHLELRDARRAAEAAATEASPDTSK